VLESVRRVPHVGVTEDVDAVVVVMELSVSVVTD
jgi:hypothetical protein